LQQRTPTYGGREKIGGRTWERKTGKSGKKERKNRKKHPGKKPKKRAAMGLIARRKSEGDYEGSNRERVEASQIHEKKKIGSARADATPTPPREGRGKPAENSKKN